MAHAPHSERPGMGPVDWSAVSQVIRERITFPPFPPDHLINSLIHLGGLATPDR